MAITLALLYTLAIQPLVGVLQVVEAVLFRRVVLEEELEEELGFWTGISHFDRAARNGIRDLVFGHSTAAAQSFPFRSSVLSTLLPSSCSSTRRSGNRLGIILRGEAPSTTEYLEKSSTPRCWRRKSSSSSSSPLMVDVGALSMARIASEKIVCVVC